MTDFSNTTTLPEALFKSLQDNNPFIYGAAAEPWHNSSPDVVTINRQAFEDVLNLIKSKADAPKEPLAGTVLGEAGEGKTHLLRRILLACEQSASPTLFVFVKPWINSKQPFQHLLREMVFSLAEKNYSYGEDRFSQFERLVAEIIRDYVRYRVTQDPRDATSNNRAFLEQFNANVFHVFTRGVNPAVMEIIEKKAVNYVHNQVPRTSREFLKVVFQYKDMEKRGLVVDWLQGKEIDEEDYETLGVPSREKYSDEKIEQQAQEIILTLGILFSRYRLPTVICFDQLDSLTEPEQIVGFGKMIDLLVNHAENILPLAFIREVTWHGRFKKHLDDATFSRLKTNTPVLSSPTKDEAKELVSRRIEQTFGQKNDEVFAINNWLLPLLEKRLQPSAYNSAREVIQFANEIIRGVSEPVAGPLPSSEDEIAKILSAEYKTSHDAVSTEFNKWIPESGYLQKAAQLFLKHQESVQSCTPGDDKYTMSWTGTLTEPEGNGIPYICFINKSGHHSSVLNALARAKEFLQKYPNGICTYVADARHDFKPTWMVTNERRREVENLGGRIMILEQPAVVRWYGLVSLSWKIGGGDILIGTHPASYEDLANFLRSGFSTYATEGLFDRLIKKHVPPPPPPPPPPPSVDVFIDAVQECLLQSSSHVMDVDCLVSNLHEKKVIVTQEWCLEQIGKNQHIFNLVGSSIVMLVPK